MMDTPSSAACPRYDRWKYGMEGLPTHLGRDAATAREHYRTAGIAYLVGALDSGPNPGTFNKLLDHSCSAELQGTFRLQRAQNYVAYERETLRPSTLRTLTVVPGCAHDAGCVLPSAAANQALFGTAGARP
jgi:hypothetical protein